MRRYCCIIGVWLELMSGAPLPVTGFCMSGWILSTRARSRRSVGPGPSTTEGSAHGHFDPTRLIEHSFAFGCDRHRYLDPGVRDTRGLQSLTHGLGASPREF